jgi:Na+:H+ antiporter, NhaA family
MGVVKRKLSKTFNRFFDSEKSGGILLIVCTVASLAVTNSILGTSYSGFWQSYVGGLSLEHWINDALMAVFFLLIGLELERELYVGELSDFKNALLPIFAAVGGICLPLRIQDQMPYGGPFSRGAPIRRG